MTTLPYTLVLNVVKKSSFFVYTIYKLVFLYSVITYTRKLSLNLKLTFVLTSRNPTKLRGKIFLIKWEGLIKLGFVLQVECQLIGKTFSLKS